MADDGSAMTSAHSSPGSVPAARTAGAAASGGGLSLGPDAVLPQRGARKAKVRTWKDGTLHFYDALPAKWDWSLNTAVAKWNAAGGQVKLVRTTAVKRAQVRIGYGDTGSAAGLSTVGAKAHAYVRLSSRFSSLDAVNARNRVSIMIVLAHELGHVLGFQHTTARCSLMSPAVQIDACGVLPAAQPGYYKCRTLDTALVQRFIRTYGGRARYPHASWCLIDPLPQALSGVTFTDGNTSPVTVQWKRPSSVPPGSSLIVRRWHASTCGTAPSSADTFRPSMTSGLWRDEVTYEHQTACFQVQLVNRYGAGRPAQSRVLARWVPKVAAPEIGEPTYDFGAEQFTFSASVPAGTTLRARWDDGDPTACVTSPTGGAGGATVSIVEGHGSLAAPAAFPQCVSFFADDAETNRVSDPVFVTFSEPDWPNPSAPFVGTPAYDRVGAQFTVPVTVADGAQLVARWNSASPSTCVTSVTAGSSQSMSFADGVAIVAESGTFPRCVSFFANDVQHARHSAATSKTLTVPAPATPTIGEVTWDAAAGKFHAPASLPDGTHLAYNMSNTRGACPATSAGASNVTVSTGIADFQTVYPDQCVSFYSVDNRTGVVSAPKQLTTNAPLPTETATMGPISILGQTFYPWFEAQLGGAAPGDKVGYAVFAGSCPDTVPTITQWRTQREGDPGIGLPTDPHADYGLFPSAAAGTNCVAYTSLDWFGWSGGRPDGFLTERHGPVQMREFVDNGPPAPTVGAPSWNSALGRFEIPVSPVANLHAIYDPSAPTTCPSPGAVGAQQVPLLRLDPRIALTPPAPHACVTLYVQALEGPKPVSPGVPVDLVVPGTDG
jgi:hypothetical protein